MPQVLIAGGTGALGSALTSALLSTGWQVRVMSRRAAPPHLAAGLSWIQADLLSGDGLPAAVVGIETVLNASGDPRNAFAAEVQGGVRLIEAARAAGVSHFFQVSILGIDRIDYGYYRIKDSVEAAVESSLLPWTIQRLPQFFPLMDYMLKQGSLSERVFTLPVAGDARFQPIDVADAAEEIAALLAEGPTRRRPDFGGPEVLTMAEIAEAWLAAQGHRKITLAEPEAGFFPPEAVAGFRRGYALAPERRRGKRRWADYLRSVTSGG